MTDDLVTRLRALAEEYKPGYGHGTAGDALREAADAIELAETHDFEDEMRDLKAKLAEAGALRSNAETGWTDTLDHLRKAEAEAAALREALCYYINECPHIRGGPCDCLVARQALAALEENP